jgi:hypothetical protein
MEWDDTPSATKVDNARSEYLAFVSYLDAYRTFGKWKDVLSTTSTTTSTTTNAVDVSMLNPTETNIAQQRMVKDWLLAKKATCQTVIEAAEQARQVLYDVLTHPGGWLSIDDEEHGSSDGGDTNDDNSSSNMDIVDTRDPEDKTRHKEIKEIRARYLVLAVNLYHQVCEETASWMSRSLDDAVTAVHMTPKQAALLLSKNSSSSSSGGENSTTSCYYAPSYWYQEALELATLVANDRHGIHKAAFRSNTVELQEFLAKLAETAVSKLMNA